MRQRGRDVTFNGFMSYSHAADNRLAPAVQRGLHRLAKPWHRRRALWIFRDQTGLAVTPALWSSIQTALDGSEYFVLLASPEAARSRWVNREIEHWLATKSEDRILPVVTDGHWEWDPVRRDFTDMSTAVPAALQGVFREEPLFLDLRWARDDLQLNLRHSRFRDAIAQLAAPMHGMSKDDLEGEDVRQHRRARQLRSGALTTVLVLALVASITGVLAVRNAGRADTATAEALRQERSASQQRAYAEQFAGEARRQQELAEQQQARARAAAQETRRQELLAGRQRVLAGQAATEAKRQRQLAGEQKALAERATADAVRQERLADDQRRSAGRATAEAQQQRRHALELRQLADRTAERAREQERLAQRQEALAQSWAREAKLQERAAQRQRQVAQEQERLARQATQKADREQRAAARQLTVAVGRRLINKARSTIGDDPRTALMLGAAADTIQADTEVRRELAGLVASTRYAGTLDGMRRAAFGADDVLAAADEEHSVSLWNVADRAHPIRLADLDGSHRSSQLTVAPSGRLVAFVDASGVANLWDVTNPRRPVRKSRLPESADISEMAFSPDGRTLVVVGYGSELGGSRVILWDVADPARPRRVSTTDPDQPIQGLTWSPDGRTLVIAGDRVDLWNVTDRARPVWLTTLYGAGRLLAFSPRTALLATAEGGTVAFWDLTDPAQPAQSGALVVRDYIRALSFAPDGRSLAVGGGTEHVTLWNVVDPWQPMKLEGMASSTGVVSGLSYSPDRSTLATFGDGGVTLWNTADYGAPRETGELLGGHGAVRTMISPDARSMVTVHQDGTAIFWDVSNPQRPRRRMTLPLAGDYISAAAFSRDMRTAVAAGGSDAGLTLTDVTDPRRPRPLASIPVEGLMPRPREVVKSLAFSPDGRTLAAGGSYGLVTLWDTSDRSRPRRLVTLARRGTLESVAFAPDGRTLAVTYRTGEVVLWGLADRSAPVRLASLMDPFFVSAGPVAATFSPDGRSLVTRGPTEATAMMWDISTLTRPQRIATLPGFTSTVVSAHFSPDQRTLVTAAEGGTVVVWDVVDRARPLRLATLNAKTPHMVTAMFLGDGNTLATNAEMEDGGPVTLWDYSSSNDLRAEPARPACAITGRGLNAAEWALHIPELPFRPTCRG